MLSHKKFIEKATQIAKSCIGTRTAFFLEIDFIDFKLVNRFYGIEKGNALLSALENLSKSIPEIVLGQRIFSDQVIFLVLTKEPRTDEEIVSSYEFYANRFLAEQQAKYPACNLKLCCGICPIFSNNILEAIDNAALARKEAHKKNISNAVIFTEQMIEDLQERQRLERETSLALHEKRFLFYLQPKIDLTSGQIVGAEALARRVGIDGNVIYPDSFLSIMEQNGSILELDYFILEGVCSYLSERIKKGLPVVKTSVNLSRLHIKERDAAKRLHAIVQSYQIPPMFLEFELTETILLTEFAGCKVLVDQLRSYGYAVSIDDYGAGYTGITIWQQLDFDIVKLDKGFLTEEKAIKEKNEILLPKLIQIAQCLGIEVIGEGVETAEQCQMLASYGCNQAQGFYFSPAIPPDMFYENYQKMHGCYSLPYPVLGGR